MDKYYIVTFKNTHDAVKGEQVANTNELKVVVMPTPTYITKSCGISLKVEVDNYDKLQQLVEDEKLTYKNIYLKDTKSFSLIK